MILNPFLEGLLAVAAGTGLCVLDHFLNIPALSTYGTLLMGAGGGYILNQLGPKSNGAAH